MDASRLAPEAAQELAENGVTLAGYDQVLAALAAETEPQTVLADPASVNYAVYEALSQNPALTVKDAADPLLPMKGVKNPTELAHLRQAHIRDGVAMVRFQMELEQRLADGEQLSELTIDEILHKHRSAQDKFLTESFGTIAAYGPNAAMMHYHATEEDHAKLERRGFLLVDSGATYMDGTTDITRTYPLGELTQDERAFYTWTLQCHIDIAKAVWLDYCDGHMLDTLAREPLWQHLINYRCGTGHSVSFVGNVHEGPHALNGRNTTVFRPGMIVTDEPGVYEGGVVGIRIENELECVHKATNQYGTFLAFEPVTFVPIDTSPILPGVLNADQLAWLNEYHRQVYAALAPHLTEAERNWLAGKCAAIGCWATCRAARGLCLLGTGPVFCHVLRRGGYTQDGISYRCLQPGQRAADGCAAGLHRLLCPPGRRLHRGTAAGGGRSAGAGCRRCTVRARSRSSWRAALCLRAWQRQRCCAAGAAGGRWRFWPGRLPMRMRPISWRRCSIC